MTQRVKIKTLEVTVKSVVEVKHPHQNIMTMKVTKTLHLPLKQMIPGLISTSLIRSLFTPPLIVTQMMKKSRR